MDDRLRQLRTRLRAAARGKAPTGIRYPAAVRRDVVALVHEAEGAGQGLRPLARALGLPRRTLLRWGLRTPRRVLRSVQVAAGGAGRPRAQQPRAHHAPRLGKRPLNPTFTARPEEGMIVAP